MKIKILIITLLATFVSVAQTKLIAHKSHSGSKQSFSKLYQKKSLDGFSSNFGIPGRASIVIVDTIIAVNNSTTIFKMRKSNSCYLYGTDYKNVDKSNFSSISDTLTNDKIFNKRNTVLYIKQMGKKNCRILFANSLDEVVFIGFRK